jgi:hypothetical protein
MLTTIGHTLSPTTLLNHELDHVAQKDQHPKKQSHDGKVKVANYKN